jgi:hypothetical protein
MCKITNLGGARKISREFSDLKEEEPNVQHLVELWKC